MKMNMDVTSSAVGAMGSEDAVGDVDAARDALPGDVGWLPTSFRGSCSVTGSG
jgi:hypothetical protein